jgi:hypothetical protein
MGASLWKASPSSNAVWLKKTVLSLALVERGGSACSFHVDDASMVRVTPIIREYVRRETIINTDESNL